MRYKTSSMLILVAATLISLLGTRCTDPGGAPSGNRPPLAVSPSSASVAVNSSKDFVINGADPIPSSATWTLTQGGNPCSPQCGTLTNVLPGSVTYLAPSMVPGNPNVTLTFDSPIDFPTGKASAMITITGPTITVAPRSASVRISSPFTFHADVPVGTNQAISWNLSFTKGGASCSPGCGTLDAPVANTVTYRAPAMVPNPNMVFITGTLQTSPPVSDSALITVTPTISVAPHSASVGFNLQAKFTATVNGTPNQGVTWRLDSSCLGCGTLDSATANPVTYTAPNVAINPNTVALTATSQADPNQFDVAIITVGPNPGDFSLAATPSSQTVSGAGGSAAYTVTVTPLNGFAGTVTFSVMGLPTGATASFNPPSLVLPISTTTMTVTASAATPNGMNSLTVTGTSGSVSHTANVTLVVGIPGSSLCPAGTYPFLFNGFNSPILLSNSAVIIAGVFTIDASGALSSGAEDINSPSLITARQLDPSFSSCTIVSGNRGILILSIGPGSGSFSTIAYHFTMDPISHNGEFIEFDDTTGKGSHGSGFFERRSNTPLDGLPGLVGDRTVGLSGYFGNGVRVAAVGRFTIDATTCTSTSTTCAISNGVMDSNAGPPGLPTTGPLTGSFTAPDPNGRGSATLVVPNPINGQSLPMNFTYYIVGHNTGLDVDELVLVQSPDIRSATVPTLGGRIRRQSGPGCGTSAGCKFDSTSLGTIVFSTGGMVATGIPSVAVGRITGTGTAGMRNGTLTGTLDQNAGGTVTSNAAFDPGGSYTVDLNGRTIISFTAGGITKTQVAYLSPSVVFGTPGGFIMDSVGSDVGFGEFATQVAPLDGFNPRPFNNSDLNGVFRVNSKLPTSPVTLNESGQATLDGNGALATSFGLTVDISGTTGLLSNQVSMGTYSVSGNGRFTVSLTSIMGGPTQDLVFWIITRGGAGGQFVGISSVTPGGIGPILLRFLQ